MSEKMPKKPAAAPAGGRPRRARRPAVYEMGWRNKWLTSEATTIDDMIEALQDAADYLRDLRAAGVVLDADGGQADDYATLITTDRAVARRLGFARRWVEDEDDQGVPPPPAGA